MLWVKQINTNCWQKEEYDNTKISQTHWKRPQLAIPSTRQNQMLSKWKYICEHDNQIVNTTITNTRKQLIWNRKRQRPSAPSCPESWCWRRLPRAQVFFPLGQSAQRRATVIEMPIENIDWRACEPDCGDESNAPNNNKKSFHRLTVRNSPKWKPINSHLWAKRCQIR